MTVFVSLSLSHTHTSQGVVAGFWVTCLLWPQVHGLEGSWTRAMSGVGLAVGHLRVGLRLPSVES